jgi:hypothetical protein
MHTAYLLSGSGEYDDDANSYLVLSDDDDAFERHHVMSECDLFKLYGAISVMDNRNSQ